MTDTFITVAKKEGIAYSWILPLVIEIKSSMHFFPSLLAVDQESRTFRSHSSDQPIEGFNLQGGAQHDQEIALFKVLERMRQTKKEGES